MKAQIIVGLLAPLFIATSAVANTQKPENKGYPPGCTPEQRGCGLDRSRTEKGNIKKENDACQTDPRRCQPRKPLQREQLESVQASTK